MILSNWAILAILTAVVSENLMTACATLGAACFLGGTHMKSYEIN